MLRPLICCLLLITGAAAFAQTQPTRPPTDRPSYGGKLKPEQANIDVLHYTIDLALDIPDKSISGYTIIRCNLLQPAAALLFDLMDSFKVEKALVNDKPA